MFIVRLQNSFKFTRPFEVETRLIYDFQRQKCLSIEKRKEVYVMIIFLFCVIRILSLLITVIDRIIIVITRLKKK